MTSGPFSQHGADCAMQTSPLQTNSYDCGVWVLACIAAILRGYTSVKLSAEEITDFRERVLGLVYVSSGVMSNGSD